ncbi:hypothetical protein [Sphingomonas sp.]|uniref:hypothetical protein n=1 Tax=Sphingomonas sp. TaxID=28214 RepID=UPI0025CFA925|nr:hypothetical protein [Sphingomonas sp.]
MRDGDGFDNTLASRYPEVAELARLEWMLSRAFESENAAAMAVYSIAPIDWEDATLAFLPSLRTVPAITNAGAIWSALAATQKPPAAEILPQLMTTMIWRQEFKPCFRTIGAVEHEAIAMIIAGADFAALCEMLIDKRGETEGLMLAGTMLGQWFVDGLVSHTGTKGIPCV